MVRAQVFEHFASREGDFLAGQHSIQRHPEKTRSPRWPGSLEHPAERVSMKTNTITKQSVSVTRWRRIEIAANDEWHSRPGQLFPDKFACQPNPSVPILSGPGVAGAREMLNGQDDFPLRQLDDRRPVICKTMAMALSVALQPERLKRVAA